MSKSVKSKRELLADHVLQLYLYGGFGVGIASLFDHLGAAVMVPVVLVAIVTALAAVQVAARTVACY